MSDVKNKKMEHVVQSQTAVQRYQPGYAADWLLIIDFLDTENDRAMSALNPASPGHPRRREEEH